MIKKNTKTIIECKNFEYKMTTTDVVLIRRQDEKLKDFIKRINKYYMVESVEYKKINKVVASALIKALTVKEIYKENRANALRWQQEEINKKLKELISEGGKVEFNNGDSIYVRMKDGKKVRISNHKNQYWTSTEYEDNDIDYVYLIKGE